MDARSISRAAAELSVPRATLGRRLERLEERLGVRLLHRSTRRLTLTDAGEELYRRASGILGELRDAERAVRRADGAVQGRLRVSAPPDERGLLHDLLLGFLDRHPGVQLEVDFTTAHVDLVASGYDVAIRAANSLDPGLIARRLQTVATIAVASPAYLARAGTPTSTDALAGHACLLGFARGELPATHWPLLDGGRIRVEGVIVTNSIGLLREAAVRGKGIALVPEPMVQVHLTSGELVRVLPGVIGTTSVLAAVYPARELVPPTVRAFVDYVASTSITP